MALSLAAMRDLTADLVVDLDRMVASGGYGAVYKGRLTRDVNGHSGEVAVKVTRNIPADGWEKVMKAIKHELDIWQRHRHPYILPLVGVYLHQGLPCAVSPWCESGTLLQYVKSAREGHEAELDGPVTHCDFDLLRLHCLEMKLLMEVAEGLAYLHVHEIAHGDIKSSNILVKGGVAQLGDFGFTVIVAERSGNTSSHLGTYRWFAPESFEAHAHRTREADMWAFGCVILEVRTLHVPYHRVPDVTVPLATRKDRPFERPKDIHPSIWSMAEACWSRSPNTRIVSPILADRMKTTLEYGTLLRKALGALPNVHRLRLEYPNSSSTARFSLASVISKRDYDKSLDLTVAVATARNALRALEAPEKRYSPTTLRPTIGLIAITSPQLAEQWMRKLSTPSSRSPLRGHISTVCSAAFLPDGRRLVSSSYDMTLRIWDIETGKTVIGPLVGHTHLVRCVAVHEDGTRIATAGNDYRAAVWDANTGVQLREMVGRKWWVLCVAFSEDGTRLVSGSADKTVRIWDVASGECIGEPLNMHTYCVRAVCFSPDDKCIFSSSNDGTIRIWDAETRALIVEPLRMDDAVLCMALSPDGKRLVLGSYSGKIALWDAQTGAAIPTPFKDHEGPVWSVVFSPDGRMIASASTDKTIALWDATDDWKSWDIADEDMVGHAWWVMYVTFSEDGTRLVSGSKDTTVRIWDVASGRCIGEPLTGHTGPVRAVCFSRDGRHVFSSSDDSTIRIWDAETRGLIVEPDAPVLCMVLSPDGNRLVSGSSSGKIAMWDAQTGAAIPTPFKDHTATVLGVAFSPDGRTIASASEDRTITLWDATDDWKRWDMDDQDVEQDDD
ncbi:WD40 repeat-like protein [Exidia glandulosa HHB12029]|uniref:WD40 repeat-like protein n=1 Tax=Exidia glandulosa HHB12029 TaxID=1314781 RepID=A0A165MXZ0_EXIGL|nr:WD40 repeat-like protein [Exidia glandulosa HHB12029]